MLALFTTLVGVGGCVVGGVGGVGVGGCVGVVVGGGCVGVAGCVGDGAISVVASRTLSPRT